MIKIWIDDIRTPPSDYSTKWVERSMMEWIPCTECIYVNEDCVEARRADGCYCGEREESLKEKYEGKNK